MIQKLIHRFIRNRHPWRDITFSELAEIYTSMSLRSLGFGIIGIFVPVYLYKNGISIQSIFLFYSMFFLVRTPINIFAAQVVAKIGPKHTIALSNIVFIVFLLLLITLNTYNWSLFVLSSIFSIANGLFFLAYHTDFSKVKDSNHGGIELGWLYIFERAGSALGPLIGGFVAAVYSPEVSIMLAIIVMFASLIPLFLTKEPVKIGQKLTYKGFKWRESKWDFISMSALGLENVASLAIWPLLVAVVIFTDGTYAKLGALVAFSLAFSMYSAHIFGKVIDNRNGKILLTYGVIINSITHVIRSFITSVGGAIAVTVINEPTSLAYRMPLTKGLYDAADGLPGYRIVYFTILESISSIAKFAYCFSMYIACNYFADVSVLRYNFIFVAVIALGVSLQRFKALEV